MRRSQAKDPSQAPPKRPFSNAKPAPDTRISTEEVDMTSVDLETKSKARISSLLNDSPPQSLTEQLILRDSRLEELQNRILTLESEGKINSAETISGKNKQIASLQEECKALYARIEEMEEGKGRGEAEMKEREKGLREEKENLEIEVEGLTEELEAVRTKLRVKEEQNQNMRHGNTQDVETSCTISK